MGIIAFILSTVSSNMYIFTIVYANQSAISACEFIYLQNMMFLDGKKRGELRRIKHEKGVGLYKSVK